ncbi:hypothetical protein GGR01_003891 [Acetobacter oeni]|nr:hypothetical protein [Acetobacter oeni]
MTGSRQPAGENSHAAATAGLGQAPCYENVGMEFFHFAEKQPGTFCYTILPCFLCIVVGCAFLAFTFGRAVPDGLKKAFSKAAEGN